MKLILFQHRKGPEAWPKGVRPEVPRKPERLKNRVTIQEDCEYLEPALSHVYEEPTEEWEPAYDPNYEPPYEPVGGMENLEWREKNKGTVYYVCIIMRVKI